jgi:predicted alpha/beta hydrolase
MAQQMGRVLLGAAWAAAKQGATERFVAPASRREWKPLWYRTEDGWEAPLWHRPPRPGAHGSPVVIAIGLGLDARCVDLLPNCSLANALHKAGYDAYLLTHRGDAQARPPAAAGTFDFDDIIAHDIPAAITAVRQRTGAKRVLWVGHGMGGMFLYSHLARNSGHDLAAGVAICAPIRFPAAISTERQLDRVMRWLPSSWRVPHRAAQRWLLASGRNPTLAHLSARMEGPALRRLALDGTADLSAGLVRQIGQWHRAGHLCDRDNRFDDLEALRGRRFPLLGIAAAEDHLCPLDAAQAATDALETAEWSPLPAGWGHLDPILGDDAPTKVFPQIIQWLNRERARCW